MGSFVMDIVNKSDVAASWCCYNSYDAAKWVALASGDLQPGGGSFSYQPPKNDTGLYFVRFTAQGGGTELAGGITKQSGQAISLTGANGQYQATVTNS
jgi:hypothetical protein